MLKYVFLLLIVLSQVAINAQTPFNCNGRMFRVIEKNNATTLQEIILNGQRPQFIELQSYKEIRINGIAYNQIDNFIYGVVLDEPYALCRIDGNHQLEVLTDLPLPTELSFVAGDISPDGRYLVLLGFGIQEKRNILAKVDLQSPTYETSIYPISALSDVGILCADIAFHPTSNVLYGFDHREGRLITIDIDAMKIDNISFPILDNFSGNVPSLFFDHRGNLYGIGSRSKHFNDKYFVNFDINTGRAKLVQSIAPETFQDACSCPVVVDVLNKAKQRKGFLCSQIDFELTLINQTGETLKELTFKNNFPPDTRIIRVSALPFGGNLTWDDNSMLIEQLTLPHGRFSFEITLEFTAMEVAQFSNQATLSGVDIETLLGQPIIQSDDPETLTIDDPTNFSVDHLEVAFEQAEYYICNEEIVTLSPDFQQDVIRYKWSNGSTNATLQVQEAGIYDVTLTTACEQAIGSIEVIANDISLDLGDDEVIEKGETIKLTPNIYSDVPIQSYQWRDSEGLNINCFDCSDMLFRPKLEMNYSLTIRDEVGCTAQDQIAVELKSFAVFAPTAFSPNGDKNNEVFFLQSSVNYDIELFQIFDRWGGILFQQIEGLTNDEAYGWNGRHKNGKILPGVYLWQAKVLNKQNKVEYLKGELLLVLHKEQEF